MIGCGEKVAEGRIEHTQAGLISADEPADVGLDLGTPVVEAVSSEVKSSFTGRIPASTLYSRMKKLGIRRSKPGPRSRQLRPDSSKQANTVSSYVTHEKGHDDATHS